MALACRVQVMTAVTPLMLEVVPEVSLHPVTVAAVACKRTLREWCYPKFQEEWFAVKVAFALAMAAATQNWRNVIVSWDSLGKYVKGSIALDSLSLGKTAVVMAFAKWASVSARQVGACLLPDCWQIQHCPMHAWIRSALQDAVRMANA